MRIYKTINTTYILNILNINTNNIFIVKFIIPMPKNTLV